LLWFYVINSRQIVIETNIRESLGIKIRELADFILFAQSQQAGQSRGNRNFLKQKV